MIAEILLVTSGCGLVLMAVAHFWKVRLRRQQLTHQRIRNRLGIGNSDE